MIAGRYTYLCSENHCKRYRVEARQSLEADFSTAHIGFRIVLDAQSLPAARS